MTEHEGSTNGQYFIVIDDDPFIMQLLQSGLGIESCFYTSSAEFKEHNKEHNRLGPPKGVFVDIHLGTDDNGLELIPGIRERWPYCPVIVITGDLRADAVGLALAAGAHDFITKPFSAKDAAARLEARAIELIEKEARETFRHGDFILNLTLNQLSGASGHTRLSQADAEALRYLALANGLFVTRKELKKKVWGNLSVSDNALNKKMQEVRKALKGIGSEVKLTSKLDEGFSLVIPSNAPKAGKAR